MENYEKIKLIEVITNRLNPRYKKEIKNNISEKIIKKELLEELQPSYINLRGVAAVKDMKKICATSDCVNVIVEDEEKLFSSYKYSFSFIESITKVDEHTLACGGHNGQVTLLDISDKTAAKAVGSYGLDDWVRSIIKVDEHMLACGRINGQVTLLDNSDKTAPKAVGSYGLDGSVRSIIKVDEYTLACGGYDSQVTLLDIRDKTALKARSRYLSLEKNIYIIVNDKEHRYVNLEGWKYNDDEKLYKYARLYDPASQRLIPYFNVESDKVKKLNKNELSIRLD